MPSESPLLNILRDDSEQNEQNDEGEPPYSKRYEIKYFFSKGANIDDIQYITVLIPIT